MIFFYLVFLIVYYIVLIKIFFMIEEEFLGLCQMVEEGVSILGFVLRLGLYFYSFDIIEDVSFGDFFFIFEGFQFELVVMICVVYL